MHRDDVLLGDIDGNHDLGEGNVLPSDAITALGRATAIHNLFHVLLSQAIAAGPALEPCSVQAVFLILE